MKEGAVTEEQGPVTGGRGRVTIGPGRVNGGQGRPFRFLIYAKLAGVEIGPVAAG